MTEARLQKLTNLLKALLKIISILPGEDVEKLEFEVIKTAITNYIQPTTRLVIADRTNFLQLSQSAGESEKDFTEYCQ